MGGRVGAGSFSGLGWVVSRIPATITVFLIRSEVPFRDTIGSFSKLRCLRQRGMSSVLDIVWVFLSDGGMLDMCYISKGEGEGAGEG